MDACKNQAQYSPHLSSCWTQIIFKSQEALVIKKECDGEVSVGSLAYTGSFPLIGCELG